MCEPHLRIAARFAKERLIRPSETPVSIEGISYNSARGELFFVDKNNRVVRSASIWSTDPHLCDVYRGTTDGRPPLLQSVCYMPDSDTLLVFSEEHLPDGAAANWMLALRRRKNKWREEHRVKINGKGDMSCSLNNSRVLIGEWNSTFMELFRVASAARISSVHRIRVPEKYTRFSATVCEDILVAMSYWNTGISEDSVCLYKLCDDRLEERSRIQLNSLFHLQWVAGRLLASEWYEETRSNAFVELKVSGTRLVRYRELLHHNARIDVGNWCAADNWLALFDLCTKELLVYSFSE